MHNNHINMTKYLRLKPWLESIPLGDESGLLLSETSTHTLKGKLLTAMLPLLDGTRSEDEIVDYLSEDYDLSQIYYQLIELKNKEFIENVPKEEHTASAIFHDRMNSEQERLVSPARIIVTSLDGLDPQPVTKHLSCLDFCQVEPIDWKCSAMDSKALWIVLTPDYLHPDLEIFNSKAQETGVRWLPFKPDGIEPCFGPLIQPRKTACMECLLFRMRGHRINDLNVAAQKGKFPEFSQGRTNASLSSSCGLLGLELEKYIAGSPHIFLDKGVITINLKNLKTKRHELTKRPHCSACGNIGEYRLQGLPEEDFQLSPRAKANYTDGGERIKDAAETMARFETRISPVTGEVGMLTTRTDVPACLGCVATSSWATLTGHKADSSKGRINAVGTSAGKGRSPVQARTSALGEAFERYCSQYFGYEPFLKAAYADITEDAIHPLELNPFTDSQYENREDWANRASTGYIPERFDENESINWTPAWSITKKNWKYVPSAYMYYGYPQADGGKFVLADSNGVATGNCVEEAIIQGSMELVERDGVAMWWYNNLQYPCLDLSTFGSSFAVEAEEGLRLLDYTLNVLNLTTDLGIPVFAAVGLHDSDPDAEPLLGFGAHFDPRIALDRAISEMGQSWNLGKHISSNDICRKVTGRKLSEEVFIRPLKDAPKVPLSAFRKYESNDFLKDIEYFVSILDGLGIELLVTDLTRPEVGLSVVRVMAPGLVHFWPRFGASRLYSVPVKLGLLDTPKSERDLYPVPFHF